MFTKWVAEWGYSGETIDFIEEIVDLFMTKTLFLQIKDDIIQFMGTEDKGFFTPMYDMSNKYGPIDIEKECKSLTVEYLKRLNIIPVYSTRIESSKIIIPEGDSMTYEIRRSLCEWFILFDFAKMFKIDDNILLVESRCNLYIKSLMKIKEKYKNFDFIEKLFITSIKNAIQ